jgi:poly(3-hydroxybutyrate) depolymerase
MIRAVFPALTAAALALTLAGCGSDDEADEARASAMPPPASGDQGSAGDASGSDVSMAGSGGSSGSDAPGTDLPQDVAAGGSGSPNDSEGGNSPTDLAPTDPNTNTPNPPNTNTPNTTDPNTTDPDPAEPDAPTDDPEGVVPSAGCGQARALQDGTRTITSSGINRTYLLATPPAYDNTVPHRVVFMFHWNFGSIDAIVNPPDADQNTDRPFYGMGDLTDDRTIFVVPQGLVSQVTGGPGWDDTNNRDVVFTDDMLDAITSDLCIDESRVFTTGFSFGAAMSYKLACERADRFRAAAVYNVGSFSGNQAGACTTPIPYFATHGVTDGIANYQQGVGILNVFAGLNGCTAMAPPEPGENEHRCVSFEGCSVPTRFCNFGNGQDNPHNPGLNGHYPSAKDPGEATSWIPAEAWDFISQF